VRFARVAAEGDDTAGPAWEAVWDRDPDGTSRDYDDGPSEATIPTTGGPALIDLMRMSEDEVVAEAAAWGFGRAPQKGSGDAAPQPLGPGR
jgi:hypothetical protein